MVFTFRLSRVVWSNNFQTVFFHNNNSYPLIIVVPFIVVTLGLYTAIPVLWPPFEAFHGVHCLKLGRWVPQFCLNDGDVTIFRVIPINPHLINVTIFKGIFFENALNWQSEICNMFAASLIVFSGFWEPVLSRDQWFFFCLFVCFFFGSLTDVLNIWHLPQRSYCCSTWKITQKVVFFRLCAPKKLI